MSTIVLRNVKGSPLTNTEVDTNFSNLNTDKLEASTTATLTNKTISGSDNTISNVSLTAGVTGTLPVANGGTGATTTQAAIDTLAGAVTSGQYLRGDGTNVLMSAIQAADVPTLNQNTTGTAGNVTGTVAVANGGTGQTTAGAAITALTGTQVAGQYLRSDGTNASLSAIQAADVPTLNQNTTGTAGNVTGTVAVANGGTGLTAYTPNGILYASDSGTLATGSALTFDGTNVINSGAYTAPSNAAGPGTKTTIQGSTGTGQAGASGGNGHIDLIGGGGTSTWLGFPGVLGGRRRGGINIQAGTAQGDADGTFVSGSTINILGSSGTNNGISTGSGSQILISSGSVTKIDGQTNGGASVNLTSSGSLAGSSVSITAGNFSTSAGGNGGAQVSIGSGNSTSSGSITLSTGFVGISGSTTGKAFVQTDGVSSEILTTASTVAVANGGTGATSLTANNVILGNGTSAVQEVAPGTTGNVLTSNGTTWVSGPSPASPAATPTTLGTVVGRTVVNDYGNTAIGYRASASITSGNENNEQVAFGGLALFSATSGYTNTAIGGSALYSLTTGSSNTAVGGYALYSATTSSFNVAIGASAAQNTTTGSRNVTLGRDALNQNKTGSESVAVGHKALEQSNNTTTPFISYNTAIGAFSMQGSATAANNTGVNNTAIGHSALKDYTSGSQNTALGINAGLALTTGSNNTILGANAAASSPTVSNEVTVGNASVTSFRVPGIGLTWTASGLPVANGGTGATSLTANNVILGNGTSAVQEVAPGTLGNVLTSDGTTWSSAAPAASMVYPGAGIPVSTGTAWNTSITTSAGLAAALGDETGSGAVVFGTSPTLSGPTINDGYTEEIFAVTGTTPALSPTNGSIQTWTLSGNSTPTAGTWASGQSLTLMVDDGSAFTITWTSLAVTWKTNGGTAPTLNTTGFTAIQLWKVDTVIYGARVGDA